MSQHYRKDQRCAKKIDGDARGLYYTPKKAIQITNICAALHNICISYKCQAVSENLPDYDDACNLFNTDSENHTQLFIAQRTRERMASCF